VSGLIAQDFQVEFDGLLMGAGTPYQFTDLGFLDLTGVRAQMTQRTRATGGFVEPTYGSGVTRDAIFNIAGTPTVPFNTAIAQLRASTYPQKTTRPIWFQLPGQGLLTSGAQVLNRSIPVVQEFGFGLVLKAGLQFYFPDPLWYGATVTSQPVGLPTSSGGLAYGPLAYPLAYGTTNAGRVSVSNYGSAEAPVVLTVAGPQDAAGFQITSLEDGVVLTYVGQLGALDTVVINTADGSVTLNGSDRKGMLSFTQWPVIPAATPAGIPGVRTFAFTTLGSYNSTTALTVSFTPPSW
jgi:hypothetical protein